MKNQNPNANPKLKAKKSSETQNAQKGAHGRTGEHSAYENRHADANRREEDSSTINRSNPSQYPSRRDFDDEE